MAPSPLPAPSTHLFNGPISLGLHAEAHNAMMRCVALADGKQACVEHRRITLPAGWGQGVVGMGGQGVVGMGGTNRQVQCKVDQPFTADRPHAGSQSVCAVEQDGRES